MLRFRSGVQLLPSICISLAQEVSMATVTYQIPQDKRDLLEKPVVVALTTLMPDGSPQSTPVWASFDGEYILINTAEGRQKDRNLQRDGRVSILAIDPQNPYRYLEVRGEVVERTTEGALEHINQLAYKYLSKSDYYQGNERMRGKEQRVIYKIRPVD